MSRVPFAGNTEALNIIELLLHHPSFDVTRPLNKRGETALMLAISVEGGNANVVKELLKLPGIDLTQRNYNVSVQSKILALLVLMADIPFLITKRCTP